MELIKFLREEILEDILSRIPADHVLQLKRVCKQWRTLLDHTRFVNAHLHRQLLLDAADSNHVYGNDHQTYNYYHKCSGANNYVTFLFLRHMYPAFDEQISYYGEIYCDNKNAYQVSYKTFTWTNHLNVLPADSMLGVVGSCNGLICFSVSNTAQMVLWDPIYICNPITKEDLYLPTYVVDKELHHQATMASGFGYLPLTNEYKVVIILFDLDDYNDRDVQVYTLGADSGWRKQKGALTNNLLLLPPDRHIELSPGVFVDGALHWVNYKDQRIVAFDLAEEVFVDVRPPPCFENKFNEVDLLLQVLGGCLCVVHRIPRKCVDIWLLKKSRTANRITKEKEPKNWSNRIWIKELSIASSTINSCHIPLPISLRKSGEILLWHRNCPKLYNPKTANLTQLPEANFGRVIHQPIPHVNSFLSLKALGKM